MSEQVKRSLVSWTWSLDAGGKSELRRAGCSVTRSRGDAKESATEKKPPCEIGIAAVLQGKGEKVR